MRLWSDAPSVDGGLFVPVAVDWNGAVRMVAYLTISGIVADQTGTSEPTTTSRCRLPLTTTSFAIER